MARFVLGILRKQPDAQLEAVETADGLGFLLRQAGVVIALVVLGVGAGGAVTDVWLVRAPDKLTRWT